MPQPTDDNENHTEYLNAWAETSHENGGVTGWSKYITVNQLPTSLLNRIILWVGGGGEGINKEGIIMLIDN